MLSSLCLHGLAVCAWQMLGVSDDLQSKPLKFNDLTLRSPFISLHQQSILVLKKVCFGTSLLGTWVSWDLKEILMFVSLKKDAEQCCDVTKLDCTYFSSLFVNSSFMISQDLSYMQFSMLRQVKDPGHPWMNTQWRREFTLCQHEFIRFKRYDLIQNVTVWQWNLG